MKGRAYLYAVPGKEHQLQIMTALAAGLKKHYFAVTLATDWAGVAGHDFIASYGDRAPAELHARPRLVLEAGHLTGTSGQYIADRLRYISAAWNGLHGRSDPLQHPVSADRWQRFGIELAPWRDLGEYVLLLEQVTGDATAPDWADWQRICRAVIARGYTSYCRPHPLSSARAAPLAEDLARAWLAVTWSSTAAVEAVIAGVPTITFDAGSIAWPVTSHSFMTPTYTGDRLEWLYNLAYRNWTLSELEDGSAWWHLRHGLQSVAA